jgi:hypothetical protein
MPKRQVQIAQILVQHRQSHLGVVDRVQRRDRLAAAHELPHVDLLVSHPALEGRADLGPVEIALGPVELRLGLIQRGAGHPLVVQCIVELRGAGDVALRQAFPPLQFLAGAPVLTLSAGQVRARLRQLDLVVARVDAQQRRSFLEETAGDQRRRDPGHRACDLGHQVALGTRHDRALRHDLEPLRLDLHGDDAYQPRRSFLRLGRRLGTEPDEQAETQETEEHHGQWQQELLSRRTQAGTSTAGARIPAAAKAIVRCSRVRIARGAGSMVRELRLDRACSMMPTVNWKRWPTSSGSRCGRTADSASLKRRPTSPKISSISGRATSTGSAQRIA